MVNNVILMKLSLFLARLLNAYSILIWVRIIFSWIFPRPSRQNWIYWIGRVVDPYLSAFQSKKSVIGRLDFSPIIAIGVLSVVESILQYYGYYGTITSPCSYMCFCMLFGTMASPFISGFSSLPLCSRQSHPSPVTLRCGEWQME